MHVQVYIWCRDTADLILTLDDHAGPVNSVSWNPKDPCMLASCSDDLSIHIWGLETDVNEMDSS